MFNVRGRRTHVFGWNIAARQRLYGAPQRTKYDLSVGGCPRGNNDRLAAAILQAGQGGFIGHGLGEAQDIGHRVLFTGICPHTDATQGGAQSCIVDGNQGGETSVAIRAEDHLFVVFCLHALKECHTG